MQLILFVELCSEMSSRMIFWPNKSICTLIWIPSKYTQMSVNPNHYLEPCHTLRVLIYNFMLEINFAYPVLRKNSNFGVKTHFLKQPKIG